MSWIRFSSLLCEFKEEKDEDGNLVTQRYVSLGRFSFWICFIIMSTFWYGDGPDVPDSLYDVFFMMVLYNFFKKPLTMLDGEALSKMFGRKN